MDKSNNTMLNYEATFFYLLSLIQEAKIQRQEAKIKGMFSREFEELIDKIVLTIKDISERLPSNEQKRLMTNILPFQNEIRDLIQDIEYEIEINEANKLLSGEYKPSYLYSDNVVSGVGQEPEAVLKYINKSLFPIRSLFVGSGPFPISVLELRRIYPQFQFDLLDGSDEANMYADRIIQALHLGKSIKVLKTGMFENFRAFDDYHVIWVAIMVGRTISEKIDIFINAAKFIASGTIVVARTVPYDSIKNLLYSPFPVKEVSEYYEVLEGINAKSTLFSSLILRRK